nr:MULTISPECIES: hypothetical protein [Nocardia]
MATAQVRSFVGDDRRGRAVTEAEHPLGGHDEFVAATHAEGQRFVVVEAQQVRGERIDTSDHTKQRGVGVGGAQTPP